ncbi:MAG: hydroxyphenylacetyl-CoA thioesterase PaaI [Azonexus sp.]
MDQKTDQENAQQLAEQVAEAMWPRDNTPRLLGMQRLAVAPGFARIAMAVRADMTNGHLTCHGGIIFALADTAFAYACNSGNQTTVAAAASIDFLSPARIGETLIAEAREQWQAGRSGVYDVDVRTTDGRAIALFRGKAQRLNGTVIDNHPQGEQT